MRFHKSAFTLVELLVCMAIIMVLAGVLIVGMQIVQETVSRVECVNHLRSLGQALHNYHAVHNMFPNESYPRVRETLLYVALLPFVEEQSQDLEDPSFVAVYTCPSRRPSTVGAKDDFAIPRHTNMNAKSVLGGQNVSMPTYSGTTLEQIQHADGATGTILLSHKRLPGMYYERDMQSLNDGMDIGWARFVNIGPSPLPGVDWDHHRTIEPRRDTYDGGARLDFGSPHPLGSPTLWTDGRVSLYSYAVYGTGLWPACCFWNDGTISDLDAIES